MYRNSHSFDNYIISVSVVSNLARIFLNDVPSFTEVKWLFLGGVNMGARVKNLPWFNSLRALQPLRNWQCIGSILSSFKVARFDIKQTLRVLCIMTRITLE